MGRWISTKKTGWEAQLRAVLYRLGLIKGTNTQFVTSSPHPQNALDILKGEWRSQLPEPLAHLQAGDIPLFNDGRITWLVEQTGGMKDMTVLELGPLEGSHSYILERSGVKSITAIEANTQAYLKCLIVKELLDLKKVSFLCGDFVAYLREAREPTFDLCLASGVLYHMKNPAELIALLVRRCKRHLFLWTHYYDEALITSTPGVARKHTGQTSAVYEGFRHTLYRYEYKEGKFMLGFSGAGTDYSNWMSRNDIISCLEYFGFGDITIGFDEPHHTNGPAFALIARPKA